MSFPFFPWPWPNDYSPGMQFEIEPQGIYANTTLRFCKLFPNLNPLYWQLNYGLVPKQGQPTGPMNFIGSQMNSGQFFIIDVPSTTTAAWIPGDYAWNCVASITAAGVTALSLPASERLYVSRGTITVFPDLTATQQFDSRTNAQKILDEIDAMILATAGDQAWEVAIGRGTIAGQSIRGWTRKDLMDYRDYWLEQAGNANRIQARKGGAPNPRVKYGVFGSGGGATGGATNGWPDQLPFS